MKANVFRAALEATARVACCAAIIGSVGCQPKTTQQIDKTPTPEKEQTVKKSERPSIEEVRRDPIEEAKKKATSEFLACHDKVSEYLFLTFMKFC